MVIVKYLLCFYLFFGDINGLSSQYFASQEKLGSQQEKKNVVENGRGILVLRDSYTVKYTLKLFNKDKSVWYQFTYCYDDSDGKFDYPNKEFKPFAFNPDYFVLGLSVVKEYANGYDVIVNERSGLVKHIEKSHFLKFMTWEQYVLSAFAVGFDEMGNPILSVPEKGGEIGRYKKEVVYRPVKISNEWLQVKWGDETHWEYGWIRWKKGQQLLIEIFLYA